SPFTGCLCNLQGKVFEGEKLQSELGTGCGNILGLDAEVNRLNSASCQLELNKEIQLIDKPSFSNLFPNIGPGCGHKNTMFLFMIVVKDGKIVMAELAQARPKECADLGNMWAQRLLGLRVQFDVDASKPFCSYLWSRAWSK